MFEMWFFTVFGLMCSSPAITALSLPFAISFSTSISRSDSSERIMSASRCDELEARTRCSTFEAIVGESDAAARRELASLIRRVKRQEGDLGALRALLRRLRGRYSSAVRSLR